MINLTIIVFIFILIITFICGMLINTLILEIIQRWNEEQANEKYILDYISKYMQTNGLPKKLIYEYLTKEEKENILNKRKNK